MDFLYTVGIFEAFFLSIFILTKKNKSVSDKILALYLWLVGIHVFINYLEYLNARSGYSFTGIIFLTTPFLLLHAPIIWYYITSLTTPNFRINKKHLIHILPFILFVIIHSIYFNFLPGVEKLYLIETDAIKELISYKLLVVYIVVVTCFYLIWSYKKRNVYKKTILNIFSTIEKINLNWLRFIIIATLILYSSAFSLMIVDMFLPFIFFKTFEVIGFGLLSIFIILLGFYGHRQTNIFTSVKTEEHSASEADVFSQKVHKDVFGEKLNDFMKSNKPYLDPELNISKLASELNVSVSFLSSYLNAETGKNFFEFVNEYRLQEFKSKVNNSENNNYTLLSLAFDCGFSSKATFNRVFKNHTNMTPNEYKKKFISS
jgi:AraC-like DNA-binding protein